MTPYEIYLESVGAVSESDFNDLINSLPEIEDFDKVHFYDYDPDFEGIVHAVIEEFLSENTEFAYVDCLNLESKTVDIEDINSEEELDKIKAVLSNYGWTISNFEDIVSYLKEIENEEKEFSERKNLISLIENKASIEQLREIVKSL